MKKRTVQSRIVTIRVYGWAKNGHAVKVSTELHLDVKLPLIGRKRITIQVSKQLHYITFSYYYYYYHRRCVRPILVSSLL